MRRSYFKLALKPHNKVANLPWGCSACMESVEPGVSENYIVSLELTDKKRLDETDVCGFYNVIPNISGTITRG